MDLEEHIMIKQNYFMKIAIDFRIESMHFDCYFIFKDINYLTINYLFDYFKFDLFSNVCYYLYLFT